MEALGFGYRERITDMQHAAYPRSAAGAARSLCGCGGAGREAGFDGVELHYAHAYTMASFLSRTNTRDDGYGGARENRVRLPLEVFAEVRRRVGKHFAVGCRFLADECIDGGSEVDDAAFFGAAFARAGMDFLSTSRGGKFDDAKQPAVGGAAYPYTGQSGYECMPQYISDERGPFGRNAEPTAAIRKAVRDAGSAAPVVCTGGVHNFEMAEDYLAARRLRHCRRGAAIARRSGLVSQNALGARAAKCGCANTPITAKGSTRNTRRSPASSGTSLLSAGTERRTPDGKRRLTAPAWQPPDYEHDPRRTPHRIDLGGDGMRQDSLNEIIARVSAMQNCINRPAVLSANEIRDNLAMTTENRNAAEETDGRAQ